EFRQRRIGAGRDQRRQPIFFASAEGAPTKFRLLPWRERSRLPPSLDQPVHPGPTEDRKSTRLNSSHVSSSYAVFCLKKKNKLMTNVRCSLMAVNIHLTIIELNALHTKRQNLFQELDAVIHLLLESKHSGVSKRRNA